MILNELIVKGKSDDIKSTIADICTIINGGFFLNLEKFFSKEELVGVNISNMHNIIRLNTEDTIYFFTDKALPSLPLKLSKKYPEITFKYLAVDRSQCDKIIMRIVKNIKGAVKGEKTINDMSVIEPDSFYGMKLFQLINDELEEKILNDTEE